jgi:hypothetical protein
MTNQEGNTVITPEENPKNSNIWWIILIVVLVIFICCCAGILIFYYWLGDILLQIFNNIGFQFGSGFY